MNAPRYGQNVLLRRKRGVNASGEPLYEPGETIACRFERAGRLALRRDGTSVRSNAALYTRAPIKEGDSVEYGGAAYPVLAAMAATSLSGAFVQNEAYLGGAITRPALK